MLWLYIVVAIFKSACCNNRQWYEFCQTLVLYFSVTFVVRKHLFLLLCSTDNLLVYVSYQNLMNNVTICHACCMSCAWFSLLWSPYNCAVNYTYKLWRYALSNVTHPLVTFLSLHFLSSQDIFLRTSQQTHVSFFFPRGDIAMLAPCELTGDSVVL
jgi:hypothetical protein